MRLGSRRDKGGVLAVSLTLIMLVATPLASITTLFISRVVEASIHRLQMCSYNNAYNERAESNDTPVPPQDVESVLNL